MAHGIMEHDGAMFGEGKAAWHGLGVVVPGLKTASEAVQLAGLGWGVGKDPLYRFLPATGDNLPDAALVHIAALRDLKIPISVGKMRALAAWVATVREDLDFDNPASDLGVVNETYQPIQNVAAFDLVDRIVGGLGAEYETAGSLFNGKQVFLLAKCPKNLQIGDDVIRPYLLCSTAHDGSKALELKLVLERVVCHNTLSVALAEGGTISVRVKHTAGAIDGDGRVRQSVVDAARGDLGKSAAKSGDADMVSAVGEYISRQSKIFEELAEKEVNATFVRDFLKCLFPSPLTASETRAINQRSEVNRLWTGVMPGNDQQVMRFNRTTGSGTAYRLFNAVTHWNDHESTVKVTTDRGTGEKKSFAEQRFKKILNPASFREDAMEILTEGLDSGGKTMQEAIRLHSEAREQSLLRKAGMVAASN